MESTYWRLQGTYGQRIYATMMLIIGYGSSRPELIDSALLRPGRLDKSLLCDMPNFEDRKEVGLRFLSIISIAWLSNAA